MLADVKIIVIIPVTIIVVCTNNEMFRWTYDNFFLLSMFVCFVPNGLA